MNEVNGTSKTNEVSGMSGTSKTSEMSGMNEMDGKIALLMGFGYESNPEMRLLSTIIDLYRMYKYTKELGCEVRVITDIQETCCLIKPILDGVIDMDITLFLDTLRKRSEYILWNPSLDWKEMICWEKYDKIIFYYTGHGIRGYIVLPDHDRGHNTLSVYTLRDIILNYSRKNSQILCLFDSCFAPILSLPFYFCDNHFKRTVGQYCSQHILCLSSNPSGKSLCSGSGSEFTKYILNLLGQGIISLSEINKYDTLLVNHTCLSKYTPEEKKQTEPIVVIASSYPVGSILWTWVTRKPN